MHKAIRFRHHWRGREPGQVVAVTMDDSAEGFGYGVAQTLVQRRLAEWVEPPAPTKKSKRQE
jgi:hypothetical protein